MSLSVCLIVKNEEATLPHLLSCLSFADEVIVVDTGSTDRTKSIATQHTKHVYDFPWCNDFAAARNAAFSYATSDYVMWLDADDSIPEASQQKLKEMTFTKDAYYLPYVLSWEGDIIHFSYYRERIFRRGLGAWQEPIHEFYSVSGETEQLDIPIYHKSKPETEEHRLRNLRIFEDMETKRTFTPRMMYYYARELATHDRYQSAKLWFQHFLKDGKGWYVDNISACISLSDLLLRENDVVGAETMLHQATSYAPITPEVCCRLGSLKMAQNKWSEAVFFYEQALFATPPTHGFRSHDYETYIPHLQLCVCQYQLGQAERAQWHNEQAAQYKPESKQVEWNREFFKKEE